MIPLYLHPHFWCTSCMAKKLTREGAQKRLNETTYRNIKITSWGGSGRKVSTFLDVERGVTFTKSLRDIISGFKVNPNRKYGATKKEHATAVSSGKTKNILFRKIYGSLLRLPQH